MAPAAALVSLLSSDATFYGHLLFAYIFIPIILLLLVMWTMIDRPHRPLGNRDFVGNGFSNGSEEYLQAVWSTTRALRDDQH